eukprot:CAMPEP_0114580848 /NCGR_PEP_ID=MMETSP0125-20121206/5037_1 /TAXON_ID=485358 ORGANISM="Aristerostoma sp., Strain ATCC 50986" /NCGR_SAMPLE_ID=MMETSP0125 /ASSEMBLY_ACC=CAM_ASM_000245 /LENGTH=99 /DNA_ID=CAMNT_0001772627 /DNA_START=778 /DNA_END=1077 /DNA_ORIENTATION=+
MSQIKTLMEKSQNPSEKNILSRITEEELDDDGKAHMRTPRNPFNQQQLQSRVNGSEEPESDANTDDDDDDDDYDVDVASLKPLPVGKAAAALKVKTMSF